MKKLILTILSTALLITTISLFIVTFSNYQIAKNTYDSLTEIDKIRMQEQKEYWQDRALITYVEEWPKFIVEFDNETGELTTESGGEGNVTIMVDYTNVTIDRGYPVENINNQTWRYYAPSGGWVRVFLAYPSNLRFNITVVKDIERFYNPFSDYEWDWWDFPPKEVIIKVRT